MQPAGSPPRCGHAANRISVHKSGRARFCAVGEIGKINGVSIAAHVNCKSYHVCNRLQIPG
jgi:hypothetical protein